MLEETEEEDGESRNVQEREREVERAKVCSARRGFVSTEKKHHSLLSKALSDTSRPSDPLSNTAAPRPARACTR